MATTSSSSGRAGSVLLLSAPGEDGALFVPLSRAGAGSGALDVFEYGAVVENRPYHMSATIEGGGLMGATCTVNGGDEHVFEPEGGPLPSDAGMVTIGFSAPASQPCPFSLVFGFARASVTLRYDDGSVVRLASQDIPCASASEVRERDIRSMLDALLGSAAAGARSWMFTAPASSLEAPGRHSVVEGGFRRRSSRSLESYLHMTGMALDVFEEQFSAVRARANTRVSATVETVPASRIRRIGNQEIIWMSRHPEVMERSPARAAVSLYGSYYQPREVQTERSVRSFATYENVLLLSFLGTVVDGLNVIAGQMDRAQSDADRLAGQLRGLERDDRQLGALVVAESYLERAERLAPKVAALRARTQRLARMYGAALPDAAPERMTAPRRTRVFQEIEPYARLFSAMRRWWDEGEYALGQEGLAINLVRSDRLFELYALFRLLDWLDRHGFSPREGEAEPIDAVRYTVDDPRFDRASRVANVYRLSSGACSVDLYYEPVVHGSALEEHGVTLHRTTGWRDDPIYTPDFVLCVARGGGPKRTFVLDAKYSDAYSLRKPRTGGDSGASSHGGVSEFESCQRKYLLEVVDASTGRSPDALWLLAGKGSADELWANEMSPWARAHMLGSNRMAAHASGVASVTPRTHSLNALFAAMGFGGEVFEPAQGKSREGEAAAPRAEERPATSTEADRATSAAPDAAGQAAHVPDDASPSPSQASATHPGEDRGGPGRETVASAAGAAPVSGDAPAKEPPPGREQAKRDERVPDGAAASEAQVAPEAELPAPHDSPGEALVDDEAAVGGKPRKREKKKVEQRKPKVCHGSKKRDKDGETAAKPTAGPKRREIAPDVLADILELCKGTFETSALFNTESARRQLGIASGPLLRRSVPKGDAKRYLPVEIEFYDGEKEKLHVYSAWTPPQARMLKATLERMRAETEQGGSG